MSDSDDKDLTRRQCPHCGNVFDVAEEGWSEGVICPYCGAEIEA